MYKNIEKVCNIRCKLGECPCWDKESKILYWIDIIKKAIHSFDIKNNEAKTINLEKYVGSIGLRRNGGIVAALQDGFYFIDEETEKVKLIKKVNSKPNNKRFNDGKVDAFGSFWAGTVSYDEKLPIGVLYCLKSSLELVKIFSGITISNGIVWSLDNKKMYFIDTPTMKVDVFDFDIASNNVRNRRVALEVPKNIGYPDGMTIDIEGKLWIAHWGGSKVCRWDPITKKIMEIIKVPTERVSSCAFGGENLSELFITTARIGFTENLSENVGRNSGYIYRVQTKTKGLKSFKFKG